MKIAHSWPYQGHDIAKMLCHAGMRGAGGAGWGNSLPQRPAAEPPTYSTRARAVTATRAAETAYRHKGEQTSTRTDRAPHNDQHPGGGQAPDGRDDGGV